MTFQSVLGARGGAGRIAGPAGAVLPGRPDPAAARRPGGAAGVARSRRRRAARGSGDRRRAGRGAGAGPRGRRGRLRRRGRGGRRDKVDMPVLVFLTDEAALRWFHSRRSSRWTADAPAQTAMDRAVAALSQRRARSRNRSACRCGRGRAGDRLSGGSAGVAGELPVVFQGGSARCKGGRWCTNDTDEDWRNVAVELVEGRPNSYLFPFVTPRFRHREVLPRRKDWRRRRSSRGRTRMRWRATGRTATGTAWGAAAGTAAPTASAVWGCSARAWAGAAPRSRASCWGGELATEAQASPEQRRELLSYRATEPLSLRAHESALVPVIDSGSRRSGSAWWTRPRTCWRR